MTQDIKDELKVRQLVIKKLDAAISALDKAADRVKAKRQAHLDALMEYKSYGEAQDAYGCGIITENDFDEICDMLEHRERVCDEPCAEDRASDILKALRAEMYDDIRAIQLCHLPIEEQNRILDENFMILREKERKNSPPSS